MDKGSVHEIIEARRRIPEADAIRIARQAACALKHAHSKGLVHRDVKPKNLMLNASGAVKLSDLGLARLANDPVAAAAEKGKVFGTPYYISPEQCRAGDIGPATDIYGLGATLYHMLTGRVPFPGANPKEVMQQHLRAQLVPPDQVVKELSGGISMIVEMMMAKDPRERYHSADHLIEDLDLVARGEPPVHARPKIDSPGAGLEGLEGPAESELVMANAPGTGGLLGSRAGIAILAVLAVSLAANLLLALMLLRR
jgi:serine/threonine-protein kinase